MKPIFICLYVIGMGLLNAQSLVINELDADTPGTDTAEFIELFSSSPNQSLEGYVLVLFNGADDASYAAYDLDGFSTDSNGYFVVGDSGVTGISITLNSSAIQNGPDAVGLYQANKSDFPTDTPAKTTNLIDAIVYDSDDADDTGLLTDLGETVQYNENEGLDAQNHSLQRQADGSFKAASPTPNSSNAVLSITSKSKGAIRIRPNPTSDIVYFTNNSKKLTIELYDLTGNLQLATTVMQRLDVGHLNSGLYLMHIRHGQEKQITKLFVQ